MTGSIGSKAGNFTGSIVIDPLTRLEGHLRIEVEVENGKVSNAYACATLFRGLEEILIGRDPKDAQHICQRVCGVCTSTHALASVRALEDAAQVNLPPVGIMIRNLALAMQIMHDHLVHFYHLHALDFVNVANALKADPGAAAKVLAARPGNVLPQNILGEQLKTVQERLKKFIGGGQLGPFSNAYFLGNDHPAYCLNPELDLIATAHYLDALHMQVKIARAIAVFGGKNPHPQATIVGGVSCYEALSPKRIQELRTLVTESVDFITNVYIRDLLDIAAQYKDVARYGGTGNFLTCGEYCTNPNDPSTGFLKPGFIREFNLAKPESFQKELIAEHVKHSWYKGDVARRPCDGETEPVYTGSHVDGRYSWSKAPRYGLDAMETGPLATILVNYAQGHPAVVPVVDLVLKSLNVPPSALNSTLGRTAARGMTTLIIANQVQAWLNAYEEAVHKERKPIINVPWEMPNDAEGVGFVNAPRGLLSHWLRIENRKIANYQMVVPTTWNISPRCANGILGPVEQSLLGVPVLDSERPVEVLRTVHSFDPCMACAVHLIDPESNKRRVFKVS